MNNILTKDEIRLMIDSPALSNEEICDVIKDALGIEVGSGLDREDMIDKVFEVYNQAQDEVKGADKERLNEIEDKEAKRRKKLVAKISVKAAIKDLIEEGKYTKKQIIVEIDKQFPEKYLLKHNTRTGLPCTCRSRVNKTIRTAKKDYNKDIEVLADGILRFEEE